MKLKFDMFIWLEVTFRFHFNAMSIKNGGNNMADDFCYSSIDLYKILVVGNIFANIYKLKMTKPRNLLLKVNQNISKSKMGYFRGRRLQTLKICNSESKMTIKHCNL